jgi:hypothetical protein
VSTLAIIKDTFYKQFILTLLLVSFLKNEFWWRRKWFPESVQKKNVRSINWDDLCKKRITREMSKKDRK